MQRIVIRVESQTLRTLHFEPLTAGSASVPDIVLVRVVAVAEAPRLSASGLRPRDDAVGVFASISIC